MKKWEFFPVAGIYFVSPWYDPSQMTGHKNIKYLSFYLLSMWHFLNSLSPWYDRRSWLCVKNQLSIHLSWLVSTGLASLSVEHVTFLNSFSPWYDRRSWLCVKNQLSICQGRGKTNDVFDSLLIIQMKTAWLTTWRRVGWRQWAEVESKETGWSVEQREYESA